MKHPKLFFGNMVIARSMCVPLLAFAGCDPHGPGCYYRCPICSQWWCYDPRTEFWDPVGTLGMFLSHHSVWKQEHEHRKANHGRTD